MKVSILAVGSRGDVAPLVALGIGLKAAGHEVRCAAPADFEAEVRARGLEYFRLTGPSGRFYGGRAGIEMRERVRSARRFVECVDAWMAPFVEQLLAGGAAAGQGADLVLCWPWNRVGPSLAEALGVPVVIVSVNPALHLPTRAFPNPFQGPPPLPLGPIYNRLTWLWGLPFARVSQAQVERWRRETLGLGPLSWRGELRQLRRLPHLFGFSPLVLPKPPDWGRSVHVTGYWFLDAPQSYQPPAELEAFLAAGPRPVAIGFSSQVGRNAGQVTETVLEALRRSGQRGILVSGWGGLKGIDLPAGVFPIASVPYGWLFPRIAAMVHHGGAASTADTLRAGLPALAIPFGYEQGLWGRRIAQLGVAARPIPAARLTPEALARGVARISGDEGMRERAARLGEAIRAEDGIGNAVRLLEEIASGRPARSAAS